MLELRPVAAASLLVMALSFSARAQFPENVVDYSIDVELDAKTKKLLGHEILKYTNRSPDRIRDLQFHLYLNAFKNQRSTFWRESGGRLRGDKAPKDGWGYIDIRALRVGGEDRLAQMEFIHPDGSDPEDQTVVRVPLDDALEPGETVVVEFEFEAKLPKVFARTGYRDNYFLVGQWFPKIGVWESVGDRGAAEAGWNCHQFHAHSEFYADFGRYEVRITVPREFVVGATGVQTHLEAGRDTTTYTFEQDNVIDFAFAASPDFIREERVFKGSEMVTDEELAAVSALHSIPREEAELNDVTMILLVQPEKHGMTERYFTALSHAIKYFGLWYGPYPYDTITVVDPPWGAGGSGGMEYPTFITGGSHRSAPEDAIGGIPFTLRGPEGVTVHEFGHQYWQSMVGSNEFEEAWLDEGINSYSTGLVMEEAYTAGPTYVSVNQIPVRVDQWLELGSVSVARISRIGPMANRDTDQILREAWRFRNRVSYGLNSYMKTAAVLRQLQIELGDDVMARVMRTYFQRWKFRHPSSFDFFAVAEEVSGRDLDWFFERLVLSPGFVDYAVAEAHSTRTGYERGVFDGTGTDGRITIDKKAVAKKKKAEKGQDKDTAPHRTTVVVRNQGNIPYPVDILVSFTDGEEIREQWDGAYSWTRFTYERAARLERVVIDPDGKLVLDVNRANNSYVAEPKRGPIVKWGLKLLMVLQNVLLDFGGILS